MQTLASLLGVSGSLREELAWEEGGDTGGEGEHRSQVWSSISILLQYMEVVELTIQVKVSGWVKITNV